MTVNRRIVVGGLVVAAGGVGLAGASVMLANDSQSYDEILAEQQRPLAEDADAAELVRYATLAANSHNTQPWRFRADGNGIGIAPDFSRRTPVVDPDDHHIFASLGCAAENLSIAARARGHAGDVAFSGAGDGGVRVGLASAPAAESPLLAAIPARQCTRAAFDGSDVDSETLARLAAVSSEGGGGILIVTDAARRESILDLVIAGNTKQLDDPAFRRELKAWLRFNPRALAATRDGLFSAASGNPTLPNWLGPLMYDVAVKRDSDNAKTTEQVRSSSCIAVFVAPTDDKAGWVAAGRSYQRFALQATLDGLKHAFINQAVEVPEVRSELQSLLGLGSQRPSLVIRFGRGPDMPRSLRRAVADVMDPA